MKLSDRLAEFRYWYGTRILQRLRPWLASRYPRWVITDALIHASQKIRGDEVVNDIPFMTVYERWYKEGRNDG